ncbi:tetratricopeptide repeat protein [Aurantibacter sp.]|uniref:tetratricopeptide repeat protein n=1 Tax=Aurantibacter sp. TaxID=2807103 RepID=UPI0035C7C832
MLKKYASILILIIINFCSPNKSYSQNNIDSLKSVWKNPKALSSDRFQAIMAYYRKNTHAKPDSTLVIADYHIELAKQKNAKREIANALNEKSYAYYLKGDTKQSMVELNKTIEIYKDLDDSNALATIYGNMGNIYGEERKYQEAVRYFSKTLEIFQENGIVKGEARMLNNLGLIHFKLENNDIALNYLEKSLAINKSIGLRKRTGTTQSHIGSVYYNQKKYNNAITKAKEALIILLENNDQFSTADCYYLLAKSHLKLNQTDKALDYIYKCLEIDKTIQNKSKLIQHLTFKAGLDLDTNLDSATKKAEEILSLINKDTKNELKVNLYYLLYRCYKAKNNYNASLTMHEKYVIYNDSLNTEKNNIVIIKDAIQKEFDDKLYQTKLKNKEKQDQLKSNHSKKTYGIIIFSLALIALILFFTRRKSLANRKKRTQLLEELERLKTRESSNIAASSNKFELVKNKIEASINQELNKTDWTVLNILLDDPVIPNKQIAEKAFMSIDGIGSSLRRMYITFNIKESKYKKISLLMEAIKISNN